MNTRVLSGPYGTRLAEMAQAYGEPQLSNPVAVLNGRHCGEAVSEVAGSYLEKGANVLAVNGFGLRGLIHRPGELPTFRKALRGQHHALQKAVEGQTHGTRTQIHRVISLGPQGDCYDPEKSPTSVREAADFHGTQIAEAALLEPEAIWVETVNTIQEAIGIAQAAKQYKAPCVISFVLNRKGELLSGETLKDAIRAVDSATHNHPLGYSLNCCPIEALEPALRSLGKHSQRVIGAYPNASSLDQRELEKNNQIVTVRDAEHTAAYLSHLAHAFGLRIIGGCCGFRAKEIGEISHAVEQNIRSSHLPTTDVPYEN